MEFVYPAGATPIDHDEAAGLIPAWIATQSDLNAVEQENILEAVQWLRTTRPRDVLSEAFVRQLHDRMFGNVWRWAGKFRSSEKNIGVDPVQITTSLCILLDDVAFWVSHETYPIIEQAVRLHHRLVSIHCFANGNGRHARLFADAFLQSLQHSPLQWGAHEGVSEIAHRKQYIDALRKADALDYGPLLELLR